MTDDVDHADLLNISRKPTFLAQQKLLRTLFRDQYVEKRSRHFDSFFRVYETELARLLTGRFQRPTTNLPQTHNEFADLIAVIRDTQPRSKSNVLARLKTKYPAADEASTLRSIQLCMKIWLMLEVEEASRQLHSGLVGTVTWESDQDLSAVLDTAFPVSRWNIDAKDSRLHPSFTAVFMTDVCNLKLEWTDTFSRHLWLDRRERKLHVFTDKAFIAAHLDTIKNQTVGTVPSPFPQRLLIETIWSLNLLFPHWDKPTNSFLEHHGQDFHQIGPFDSPPVLNLLEFEYWRDRLAEIHEVIFLAPPVSWAQLLKDRRNPQQYWTFWIALVILALTLLSTIATITQTIASFKYR